MAASTVVTEQFVLRCADESSLQSLKSPMLLGPLDQRSLLSIPLAVVFVYRSEGHATEELIPIERFRHALNRLLDYYPHLTGRIVVDPKDQTPRIEKLGAGAQLVTAKCMKTLKSFESVVDEDEPGSPPRLLVTNLPDGGNALLPPFGPTEAEAAHDSILNVQHTRFACGGVSIAIRLRHIVCDAAGFFQLACDLAELYRGFRDIENSKSPEVKLSGQPPEILPYLSRLRMSPEERDEALQICPTVFELAPEVHETATNGSSATPAPPPVIGRILRFTSKELSAIKGEANGGDEDQPFSTFCTLTAHLWQSVCRARAQVCHEQGMSSSEAAAKIPRQFLASVDLRSRGQLDISPRYFPNAVLCPVFSLPASELLDGPLSAVAAAVHGGVQPVDPAKVEQNIRWLAAQSDKERVRLRYRYEQGGVMVSQWNKFEMYRGAELDVPPGLVAQPFTPISLIDGLIYFLATEDQLCESKAPVGVTTGSIDVSLALSEQVWGILDQDARFRRHRGW